MLESTGLGGRSSGRINRVPFARERPLVIEQLVPACDDEVRYMDDGAGLDDRIMTAVADWTTMVVRATFVVRMIRKRCCSLNRNKARQNGKHHEKHAQLAPISPAMRVSTRISHSTSVPQIEKGVRVSVRSVAEKATH